MFCKNLKNEKKLAAMKKSLSVPFVVLIMFLSVGLFSACDSKTYGISGNWKEVSGKNISKKISFDEKSKKVLFYNGADRMDGVFRVAELSLLTLNTGDETVEITIEYDKKSVCITLPSGEAANFEGDIQKSDVPINGTLRQIGNPKNSFSFNNADNTFSFSLEGMNISGTYTERKAIAAHCKFNVIHIGTVDQPCDESINLLIDKTDENTFRSATGVWKR